MRCPRGLIIPKRRGPRKRSVFANRPAVSAVLGRQELACTIPETVKDLRFRQYLGRIASSVSFRATPAEKGPFGMIANAKTLFCSPNPVREA